MSDEPTLTQAREVLNLLSLGLPHGIGNNTPGEMCVEACVSKVFQDDGKNDTPACTSVQVAEAMISLNDCDLLWVDRTSNDERVNWKNAPLVNKRRGRVLRRAAIAQLGSDVIGDHEFERALIKRIKRELFPYMLELMPAKRWRKMKEEDDDYADFATWKSYLEMLLEGCEDVGDFISRVYLILPTTRSAVRMELLRLAAGCVEHALRDCKSPGVKLMDKLFPKGKRPKSKEARAKILAEVQAKQDKKAFAKLKVFKQAVQQHLHVTPHGKLVLA